MPTIADELHIDQRTLRRRLAAEGTSHVRGVEIIRRGYEKFFDKLTALGADFDVVE